MARITVEDCLEKVSNRFALIHLAAKRVRELKKGAEPLISAKNSDNVIALREIAAGKVSMAKKPVQTEPVEGAVKTKMPAPEEIEKLEKVFITQKPAQTEVVERPSETQMKALFEETDDSEIEVPEEEAFEEEVFDEEDEGELEDPFDYSD